MAAKQQGRVEAVHVKEGDMVEEGSFSRRWMRPCCARSSRKPKRQRSGAGRPRGGGGQRPSAERA